MDNAVLEQSVLMEDVRRDLQREWQVRYRYIISNHYPMAIGLLGELAGIRL